MHSLLTTLKSWYAKSCVLVALFTWLLSFGIYWIGLALQAVLTARGLKSHHADIIVLAAIGVALLAVSFFVWNRNLGHLDADEIVNSTRVTLGIGVLTIALIAFPGTLVGPMLLAHLSGNPNDSMWSYLSLIGFPVFLVLSIVGLVPTLYKSTGERIA